MRQKRVKGYRKVMQMYCATFKFREPYQLLVDAEFVQSCVQQKLEVQARLEDVLQGAVKPMITQCCMQVLYDLGPSGQASVDLAKDFERRKCNHLKARPQEECLTILTEKENRHRYVVATQSLSLRKRLRNVPGLPILYLNRSVVLLESPSDATVNQKKRLESQKLHAPTAELAFLNHQQLKTPSTDLTTDSHLVNGDVVASTSEQALDLAEVSKGENEPMKKKKRKGPKGPNPLSVQKAKKDKGATSSDTSSRKRPRKEEGETPGAHKSGKNNSKSAPSPPEKKRPRVDEDETRVESLASRTQTASSREGESKRRRKRKRAGTEGKASSAATVSSNGVSVSNDAS